MSQKIKIYFVYPSLQAHLEGEKKEYEANVGETVLQVARKNDIDIIEGACDGCLACSTCHVIVHPDWFYGALAEKSEDEEDMLDLASNLTKTSRLGCQIVLTKEMDGIIFIIPKSSRNYTPR